MKEPKKIPMLEFLEQIGWEAFGIEGEGTIFQNNPNGFELEMSDEDWPQFEQEFEYEISDVVLGAETFAESIRNLQKAYATAHPDKVSRDYEHYIQKDAEVAQ